MPSVPTTHELDALEVFAGVRNEPWGAWLGACMEFLQDEGCIQGGRITDRGRKLLAEHRPEAAAKASKAEPYSDQV